MFPKRCATYTLLLTGVYESELRPYLSDLVVTMSAVYEYSESTFNSVDPDLEAQCVSSAHSLSTSQTTEFTKVRPQRSWIWQYSVKPPPGQHKLFNKAGVAVWRCSRCKPTVEYVINGGTKVIKDHLAKYHQLSEELTPREAKRKRADEDIQSCIGRMKETGERVKAHRLASTSASSIDSLILRELFADWLAADSLPFSLCKSKAFRAFLRYINPAANDLLPDSDTTIHQDVQDCYTRLKTDVAQRLQSALSPIHVTCDLWTSGNRLGLMGVVAHCVDEDGFLRKFTIALREVEGSHSGENMEKVLWDVLSEYQILTKLGYFTMDNATNNDTMLSALEHHLEEEGIEWDAATHRVRCNGHILNLAVQAFLFGHHPDLSDTDNLTQTDLRQWRQLGPLGKLHNIVVWVQWSPQRIQAFKKDSNGKNLKRDNCTRWNSWFEMLDWCLQPELRLAIDKVSFSEKDLYDDRLSNDEWAVLAKVRDFLKPFKHTTIATQGQAATLEHILPSMDFLLQHFEQCKTVAVDEKDPIMTACIETGWVKLNHYYNLTDRTPVYIAAIVLNPRWKFDYFTDTWAHEWITDAKRKLRMFWESCYKAKDASSQFVGVASPFKPRNVYEAWIESKLAPMNHIDEYSRYTADPVLPYITDALQWWVQQRSRYPSLAIMAIDILSIPAMSDEAERVFSGARRTVTDFRGSLNVTSIEMLECVKSWRKACLH
jgi:hypothetical protein